jgi:hypothetical protein
MSLNFEVAVPFLLSLIFLALVFIAATLRQILDKVEGPRVTIEEDPRSIARRHAEMGDALPALHPDGGYRPTEEGNPEPPTGGSGVKTSERMVFGMDREEAARRRAARRAERDKGGT